MSQYSVQVSAGTGPVEVRNFVASLAERIESLCETFGLSIREVITHGEPDAPRSVEILVDGDAQVLLRDECGTHALSARSATRGRDARKRWFAGVSVHGLPESPLAQGEHVDQTELEIQAIRAPGPGGQNVNKVSSSVRVLHTPSGISVRVSDERSQHANIRRAIARIEERLHEQTRSRAASAQAARRDAHYDFARGTPVRSYELDHKGKLRLVA